MELTADKALCKKVRCLIYDKSFDEACEVIRTHPTANWNTSVYVAGVYSFEYVIRTAVRSNVSAVVAELLKIPSVFIDMAYTGRIAICNENLECFLLIIRDHRYDPKKSFHVHTALHRGSVQSLMWLVAIHGLDLNYEAIDPAFQEIHNGHPLELIEMAARHQGQHDLNGARFMLADQDLDVLQILWYLINACLADPWYGRWKVRVRLEFADEKASVLYSVVVFLCDGLLKLPTECAPKVASFFSIAERLPLELQMVLCNRTCGSTRDIIKRRDAEIAFKELASEF